jgi:cystine transport system substrate-binding protein
MKKRMLFTMAAIMAAAAMALSGCSGSGKGQDGAGAPKAGGDQADQSVAGGQSEAKEGSQPAEESGQEGGDQLAQIRQRGELIVAMEGTWSPWTYHDESDQLVGYDVEVAKLIADKLGVKATFVEGEWAGLDAGRYDLVINGVEVTDERREKYDFSEPYGYIRTAIIVDGGNMEIQSFEDLNGKKTANTISSTYAELAESYGAEVTSVDDLNQTFELLNTGRIDATLNAELTFYDYINAHPEKNLKIAALTDDASLVCIPMRKGEDSKSLREAVDQAIDEIRESGELAKLSDKYFGNDISQEPKKDGVTD